MDALYDRLETILAKGGDVPAADALEPGGRWTNLLTAVGTYISGAELEPHFRPRFHQLPRLGGELERHRGLWRDYRRRWSGIARRRSIARSAGSTTTDDD